MNNLGTRKGIILAGGTGSRLSPLTNAVSKQLMPVYDKPMIYYPLSTLLLAGINEILIICSPCFLDLFRNLLDDGSQWGIKIQYKCKKQPDGIAQALILAEEFLNGSPLCLILGDNLFYGDNLSSKLKEVNSAREKGTLFAYQVNDPCRYGIIEFNEELTVISIEEKPIKPKSNWAITGLYFYDKTVVRKAKSIKPSKRGELEITELNNLYLREGLLKVELMKRGTAWLDTGNPDSLHEASSYIKTLEQRQGLKVGCPEEVSWNMGLINSDQLKKLAHQNSNSDYGKYLMRLK